MLTFQELFSSPPFSYAEIISTWGGIERTFQHVQSSTLNMEHSTVLVLPNDEAIILQLWDFLSLEEVEGVILYGNRYFDISLEDKNDLNTLQKPIIYISGVKEDEILAKINELLVLKKNGLDDYIWNDTSSYWLDLIINQGINGLITRLKEFVGKNILFVGKQFQPIMPEKQFNFSTSLNTIKAHFFRQESNKADKHIRIQVEEDEYIIFSIREKGKIFGYIVFQDKSVLKSTSDISTKHIYYALPAICAYLKKEEAVYETHQIYQEEFLLNLLYNNIESEQSLITQGERWGWDFTKPTQLMVMQLQPAPDTVDWQLDINEIMSHVRSTLTSQMISSIVFQFQGYIVMIIFNSFNDDRYKRKEMAIGLGKKVLNSVTNFQSNTRYQIGIGRQYPSNLDLHRSFYEAKTTLELAKSVVRFEAVGHFEDMKIARLLSNIHHNVLQEYYDDVLGLIENDTGDATLETLEAYFNNNGDIAKTAESLYIHANTLRKRIKKIESILNLEFDQYDDLFEVFIALKIMKMIE